MSCTGPEGDLICEVLPYVSHVCCRYVRTYVYAHVIHNNIL